MTHEAGRVVVVRHGETAWSREGRHTGRSDVPLTPAGEGRASLLGTRLAAAVPRLSPGLVLASPLARARRTAELAGFEPELDADLLEWDYGDYEGRTTAEIRTTTEDPGWTVWTTTTGLGESADAVGERCDTVIARCLPVLDTGADAVLFAHAHLLRILATRWLGLDAGHGATLVLGPSGIGVLGHERETRALVGWNL